MAALSGGFVVNLSSNNAAASVPASVTVAQGSTSATFTATTTTVASPQTATITASAGSVVLTFLLAVNPPSALSTLSLSPTSVAGGATSTGTVALVNPAFAGGFVVSLSSDNAAATVPASVTVAQGSTVATFAVTTTGVASTQSITITATAASIVRTATLTVTPPLPVLSTLSLNPTTTPGGSPSTGTVTLTNPALVGGFAVSLSSDNAVASVPASITVAQGATTATFSVTTTSSASAQTVTISAIAGAVTRTATLLVSRPIATGELTEGNSSDWAAFASDSAATSLSDDASHVRVGSASLKLVTASGGDTGIRYPATGQLGWDLSQGVFLSFWAYIESSGTFAGNQPTVVLLGPSGSIRYTPASPLTYTNQWHHYEIALSGDSGWTHTVAGVVDLTNISTLEVHHQASPAGFTAYYDGLSIVSTLPGDLAEANASDWGAVDLSVLKIVDDTTHVRSGASSIDYLTGAGFDSGVIFPATGNAHWDLTPFDSLTFWLYAIDGNSGGFQGVQPILILKGPSGSYTYTPSGTLMSIGAWRLYQIPLSGGGPWSRSSTGAPALTDVNQLELHFDTWGYGYELFVDGLTFGQALPNLTLSPNSIVGGASSTGSVRLLNPAPAGGATLQLTSDDPSVTVPSTLFVPAGSTMATFAITTTSVSTTENVTVSWIYGGTSGRATLTVTPSPIVIAFSIDPNVIIAGNSGTGTVQLNGIAPVGGVVVTLTSAYPLAAALPPSVTVAAGANSATFAVQTYPYYSSDATIVTSASAGGVTKTFRLIVSRSSASNIGTVSFSPSILVPGDIATGTVTLTSQAPTGGATVGLSSSDTGVASVPASITVPSGASSATFAITTSTTPSASTSTISGSLNGVTRTTLLRLTYPSSVAVSPTWVVGGQSATGTVSLTGPAPASGVAVTLSSSNPAVVSVPASVSIASGANTVSFTATTTAVPTHTDVTITATSLGIVTTTVLSVEVAGFDAFMLNLPSNFSVKAGYRGTLTVTLKSAAPAGGTAVSLTSTGVVMYYPWEDTQGYHRNILETSWTLTIPAGQTSASVDWVVPWSSSAVSGSLTATLNGLSKTVSVQGTSGTATFGITAPGTVSRSGSAAAYLTFDGWAMTGSTNLLLASSNPGVVLSATSVTASAHDVLPTLVGTYTMLVGVTAGSSTGTTTISSTTTGISGSALLTVNPSVLTTVTASPAAFRGGTPIQLTANLDSPAPPEGALVSLTSSSPSLFSVPATLLVPAGQLTASTNATPQNVSISTPVTLSATYGPNTRTLPLKIWSDSAAVVSGFVFDARIYDHDQPLPGVAVSLTTDPTDTTTTDATGAFSLFVEPGSSSVSLAASGFATKALPVFTAPPNGTINEGSTRLKYLLGGPTQVLGRVTTASGVAQPGATGSLEGYEGTFTTDSNGNYSFIGPNIDPYRLTFSAPGYPAITSDTYIALGVNGVRDQLDDFVLDTVPQPALAGIAVYPNPVVGGTSVTLGIDLTLPAPPGGLVVTVTFSNPAVVTASSVGANVPAGALGGRFSIPTNLVATPQTVTITAFAEGVQLATTLAALPATGVLSSVSVSPTSVIGGSPSTGTVTLDGQAPAGGAVVALSSNDAAAAVPSSVTVLQGATTATFAVTTSAVAASHSATITAAYGYTKTATLTLTPAPPATLAGVAPGWVLPGDATPIVYGSGIQQGSTVTFTGPVYSLTDFNNALCAIGTTCAATSLLATVGADGTYAAFVVPAGAAPGAYYIKVRSAVGVDSSNNQWIAVDSAQKTYPAVAPGTPHQYAGPIYSGQTAIGDLTGDVPLNGLTDYNYYYFVGTAGSTVSVSMQRVDTSVPWENPSSLDPQIEIVAPDGYIYQNLQAFDDEPGTDLNASLTNVVLPQTGVYIISAETTRGSGQYRLTFNLTSVAPPAIGSRTFKVAGRGITTPLNRNFNPTAIMLDPRGYLLAGATATFTVEPSPDDVGAVTFPGGGATVTTSLTGMASTVARMTSPGRVRYRPVLASALLSSLRAAEPSALAVVGQKPELVIPLYRPAARRPFAVLGFDAAGRFALSESPITRYEPERRVQRRTAPGVADAKASSTPLVKALTTRAPNDAGGLTPTPKVEPRPIPKPVGQARVPLTATSCAADLGLFTAAGVSASEVYPPFTATLTDLTSPTGTNGAPSSRVVDASGIKDHRIEKTVKLRLDIKDARGQTPDYPVLVELAVGGPRHGQVIVDPDGAALPCDQASFLWHESGNSNEQFGYKLGTLALFAGLTQGSSGSMEPYWDVAEGLDMRVSTVDAAGLETQWEDGWGTHPEPGKPDHFDCFEDDGTPCPDVFRYWSTHRIYDYTPPPMNPGSFEYSSYYLADRYDNETYGYSNTSVTPPASNVTVNFFDQTPAAPVDLAGVEYGYYGFQIYWTENPSWPSGSLPSTLRVDYPSDADNDWTTGWVTKDVTFQFDLGTEHVLAELTTYDLFKPDLTKGVTDGTFPLFVKPGATAANLPKTEIGDGRRLTLLIVTGTQTWNPYFISLGNDPRRYWDYPEPYSGGTRFWFTGDGGVTYGLENRVKTDPVLELTDAPAFRFTIVDTNGKPVADGSSFRLYRCPRFDHENHGRSCLTAPVDSVGGIVDNFHVNEGGDYRGYVGIELTRAPLATGVYHIWVESLGLNYHVKPDSQLAALHDTPNAEYAGGFQIAIVDDGLLDCACETCGANCKGSPNFIGTGTYEARATDLSLPTPGFPVQVSRRYLSSNKQSGFLGLGWTTSLDSRIWFSSYIAGAGYAAQAANVLLPDGAQFRFTPNSVTGGFDPPYARRDKLVRNLADGSFDFTVQNSRTVYHFDKSGRLTTMTDEFGNSVLVTFNAAGRPQRITDQTGSNRYIEVSWRADGKIDFIQDSAGRTVAYGYATDGTLTSMTDPASRLTHYTYVNGSYGPLLSTVADNWNRVLTTVTYDAGDRTTSYTENLESYTYSYVDSGIVTKTTSEGLTSSYAVAPNGQITSRTPAVMNAGVASHTDYYADGSVAGTTDEVGVRTGYTYDTKGRVATVTRDANGTSPVRFEYTYDPSFPDKVISVTPKSPTSGAFDPNWQGWRYDYVSGTGTLNHVYRLRNDGSTTDTISTFQYDAKGRVTHQTSATGAVTDYAYTGADLYTVTHPTNNDLGTRPVTTYSNYDGVGRPRTVTDPAGKNTTYTYDALGRVLTVTLPPPSPGFPTAFTTTYSYDNYDALSGLVYTNITDPNGRLTKLGYDEHGRLLKSTDALNNTTTYAYTRDVLASITDANDNVTTYHYDPLKRLDKTTFPDGKFETYTYYADGLLKTKTDRMGQTLTYAYDDFKRLKTKTYPNASTITYTYVGQKLTQVDDTYASPSETHTFLYDSSYRVQQNGQATRGTLTYTYTPDDRVDTMTIAGTPNVTTAHTYYNDGSLNTIVWSPQSGQFKYAYTPRGQYQTVTLPNGQTRSYAYDDQGRLTQLANALGATNIATYAYGYDVDWATSQNTMLGQRVSMTANVPTQGFANALTKYSYDPLYQLQKAEYPNVAPFNAEVDQWTYDAIGNRLTSQVNASILNYSYEKISPNPKNAQKLLGDGVNAYAYDFNGSQTSRTGGASYGFVNDLDNRLASISGAESATYTYDYQGRRSSKTVSGVTTKYLYDGLNLVSESTSGATTRYAFGPSIDEPLAMYAAGAITYLDVDGLGSPVATNDPAGSVTTAALFDAWGTQRNPTATRLHPFTYTGREIGEAGLLFYRARFLDPARGRFSSEDPLRFAAGPHFYGYVLADPLQWRDPFGLEIQYANHPVIPTLNHSKLIIIPENQARWKDHPFFQNVLPDGRHFATIGAGPEGDFRAAMNRPKDLNGGCYDRTVLSLPDRYRDEDEAIEALMKMVNRFNSRRHYYALLPIEGGTAYNSNGFISGLLGAAGFTVPDPLRITNVVPGFTTPVPPSSFK
jgi:RHS repeat-associated protein